MDAFSWEKQFRTWLSKPDTLNLLTRIAGSTARGLQHYPGLTTALPAPIPDGPVSEERIADIVSELCLFLLENRQRLGKMPFVGNPAAYLRQAFLNHLREKTRKQDRDNFRYLYKRVADTLRKAADVYSGPAGGNISVFSLQRPAHPIQALTFEDFSEIPFPVQCVDALTYEAVNKKKALLDLARYFWKQVSGLHGGAAVEVPLRDFVRWLGLHIPLAGRGDRETAVEELPDPHSAPDQVYFDAAAVKTWAHNFARRLSPRQGLVLVLLHAEGLGYAEIARQTGYRGPSGPKMAAKNIEAQLRDFLIELPWVSPDGCRDAHPEALGLFWQTLLDDLKKKRSTPS